MRCVVTDLFACMMSKPSRTSCSRRSCISLECSCGSCNLCVSCAVSPAPVTLRLWLCAGVCVMLAVGKRRPGGGAMVRGPAAVLVSMLSVKCRLWVRPVCCVGVISTLGCASAIAALKPAPMMPSSRRVQPEVPCCHPAPVRRLPHNVKEAAMAAMIEECELVVQSESYTNQIVCLATGQALP